uniref:Uncharacterized protein n=1 Tax=Fervidobacterium pennivorans TaxID=93466 RepID=A0A7V4KFB3_FERPE
MAVLYNHTNSYIKVKMKWEKEWIEIPPDSEYTVPDWIAELFFGFTLTTEAQLKECYNRLLSLGNNISYEDFLKIHQSLIAEGKIKSRRRSE